MTTQRLPKEPWLDTNGNPINAHGGGILLYQDTYYWYGEHKIEGKAGNRAHVGIHAYSSKDLFNWKDEGVVLDIRNNAFKELPAGCVMERPKVMQSLETGKFVMLFHFESGTSYNTAAVGFAVADAPTGPFSLHHIQRPNPGIWPVNTPDELKDEKLIEKTKEIIDTFGCGDNAIAPTCSILGAHIPDGQDSRDMTLFRDDDGKTYHVYSSEKNSTIHIAELTPDLLGYTGKYHRIFPFRWMEAPCIFKHDGYYVFIGSGCTGWAPNAARSAVAPALEGPWTELKNPAQGPGADTTFGSQSTFVLTLKDGQYIFMADRWRPENAIDGRYLWLPIHFDGQQPIIKDDSF
ncbi:MAG: family 43 glycosylhydrolase [Lentisphaerae bacterium]|jgi:hypothetical protein|nr:family 43 glycosylhydrolase [Lentisphaerota bacterium]